MPQNPTWENMVPVSAGLKDHHAEMGAYAAFVYHHLLLSARQIGENKGRVFMTMGDLANELGISKNTVATACKKLNGEYIEYQPAKNRHGVTIFTILKFKTMRDFMKLNKSSNSSPGRCEYGKRTVEGRKEDGTETVEGQKEDATSSKPDDIKALHPHYKEGSKGDNGDIAVESNIPYEEIKDSWNYLCPMNPKPRVLTAKRRSKIKSRWTEIKKAFPEKDPLEFIHNIFKTITETPFLIGDNKSKWQADFDWVFKNQENIMRIAEGKYKGKTFHDEARRIDSRDMSHIFDEEDKS